jgi:predicted alpha/beta-hydrolase family hydrolase
MSGEKLRFRVEGAGEVSALLVRPAKPRWLLVLAHGAGAGMYHSFLQNLVAELAEEDVASLRYQFPYMEARRRVPDKPEVLTATVREAVRTAAAAAPKLPLLAGGKSMGGRMTSQAAALGLLPGIKGIVFYGFPLHPPNRPDTKRGDHLSRVQIPMLFLQGSRDAFADLTLLRPVVAKLGSRSTLHLIDNADHSFHMPKSSGRNDAEVLRELARTTVSWAEKIKDGST